MAILAQPTDISWDHDSPFDDIDGHRFQGLAQARSGNAVSCLDLELRIVGKTDDAQPVSRQKSILRIFEFGAGMRTSVDVDERTLTAANRKNASVVAVNWRKAA